MIAIAEAASFLTAVGGARSPSPRALVWFPPVGALIGASLGVVWIAAAEAWPLAVAAAIVVAADLLVTGLLHFDGLADSADGLLPHLSRERRLAVMAEPDAGAFATATVGVVLLLRWAALAAVAPDARLLAALWCLSRTAMAVIAAFGRYARSGGLATAFLPERRRGVSAAGALGVSAALAIAVWWSPLAGAAAIVAAIAAASAVVALAARRIGGFTGDVLGAAGVVAETAGLLAAAARW